MIKIPDKIKVMCEPEFLQNILKFAERTKQEEQLLKQLERLADWAHEEGEVHLGWDFAPYSFSWGWIVNGQCYINGGLIYHGAHDNGGDGGDPTFSVNLIQTNGWSIHT
jgi:hypothetical protein